MDITLSLSLFPVGPRAQYVPTAGETWRFALQIGIGFTDEPDPTHETTPDDLAQWADAMRPWTALVLNNAGSLPLEWGLFVGQESHLRGTADAIVEGELSAAASLRAALDAPFDTGDQPATPDQQKTRWQAFAMDPEPERRFAFSGGSTPIETTEAGLVVPAVLTLAAGPLPQVSSGDLHCTWYFDLRLSQEFVDIVNNGCKLIAWPIGFRDSRANLTFEYDPDLGVTFPKFPVSSIGYAETGGAQAFAHAMPLPIDPILNVTEPALKSYWLPTSDSRLDSLADVQHAVMASLDSSGRIAFLTADTLVSAGIVRAGVADRAADARLFLDVARRVFPRRHELPTAEEAAQLARDAGEIIKTALATQTGSLVDHLQSAIAQAVSKWWTDKRVVERVTARAKEEGVIGGSDPEWPTGHAGDLLAAFKAFARIHVPGTTEIAPRLPGEGLDVLLGSADKRLRPDDPRFTGNTSEHAQIAELGVLVRRAASKEDIVERRWTLATGGLAALDLEGELREPGRYWGSEINPMTGGPSDETVPYDKRPVVRGLTSAFVNGVAYNDFTYRGVPLTVATVGSALHDFDGKQDPQQPTIPEVAEWMPLTFQPVGPVLDVAVQGQSSCLVPPLRYGDWYQFASFVIDRVGGIPRELADAARPALSCYFDWSQLEPGRIPSLDRADPDTGMFRAMQFLRAVPVGEINVRPAADLARPMARPFWPVLPDRVVLRAREWLSARISGTDQVPALLLSGGPEFTRTAREYRFEVSPPALDEHTIKAWLLPSAVDPNDPQAVAAAKAKLEILNEVLATIHRTRAALPEADRIDWTQRDVLPPDPAVAKIGLRCTFVDRHGIERVVETVLAGAATLTTRLGALGTASDVQGSVITIEPGSFVAIELAPLVTADDFQRFEPLAMRELIEEDPWIWIDPDTSMPISHTAFRPTRVLIEAAIPDLPDKGALYAALTLGTLPNGAIDVSLAPNEDGQPLDNLVFVDRFDLIRHRWVWRNRPIIVESNPLPQSALPPALGNADLRDQSADVLTFDLLAELDRGLVDRGRFGGRVPRKADGSPLPGVTLLIDDRDAVPHADYLRFGCTLTSRYAGILATGRQSVEAQGEHTDASLKGLEPIRRVRRIVAPFRGDATRLKAPKVLAILPLTQGMAAPDVADDVSVEATPFLIVLDELWFREYGAGERLSVEIALETKEIGDADDHKRPFRVGPLPDRYVVEHLTQAKFVKGRLYEPDTDESQEAPSGRHTLTLVGPYGYSLDRSGNEAQANATAFIAFMPRKVSAHYAMYVRLRRALYGIDGQPMMRQEIVNGKPMAVPVEGPPGATYALYTQPDARQLVSAEGPPLHVTDTTHSERILDLTPVADLDPSVAEQHRYLLIVGPTLQDFGRGADLFLPTHAVWVRRDQSVTWPNVKGGKPRPGRYAGRVLELLINGRAKPGSSQIEDPSLDLKRLLMAIYPSDGRFQDAPATICRLSLSFEVDIV